MGTGFCGEPGAGDEFALGDEPAAGTGFAENTLCIHKGSTPRATPRLLLQLQYALFDYGAMNDHVDRDRLRPIKA